ncbi:MAG: single-stranded DNA-binding protein [Candidatus Weimeria sp.]
MNNITLMGWLSKEPEVRTASNGTKYANYGIGVPRRFKREGQPESDFFNCTSFGKQAEFVEKYLHKGTKVVLIGEMQNDNYKDKDGQTVYGFRVIVNSIEFAESKAASQSASVPAQTTPAAAPAPAPAPAPAADIPVVFS